MSSSLLSKKSIAKASIAGATAIAIDKFYFKSSSLRNSMILGGCVGASSFIVSTLKKKHDPRFGSMDSSMYSVKNIESMVLEMSLAAGSTYAFNALILKSMKPISIVEFCSSDQVDSLNTQVITCFVAA